VAVLRDRGYTFIDLDEALEDEVYDLPDEFVGSGGITWIHRWALTRGERGEFFAGEPPADPFVQEAFDVPPPREPVADACWWRLACPVVRG
jgi:hypothetical protein